MTVLLKFGLSTLSIVLALAPTESTLPQQAASPQAMPGAMVSPSSDDPADSLALPDGTPIAIKVVNGFSSADAKVGDVIQFAVAFEVREGGVVVIPQRTGFAGKVVSVSRPHRGARNGQVKVAFDPLTLPTGESVTVRSILKPPHKGAKAADAAGTAADAAVGLFITAGLSLVVLFEKGDEQAFPEGALEVVYLNGPLRLSRKAVMALQPISASGYANVYVTDSLRIARRDLSVPQLFCGGRIVSDSSSVNLRAGFNWFQMHLRLQLNPGSYWLSTDDPKDRPVRIDVLASREYAVGRNRHGLFAKELTAKQGGFHQKQQRDYPWVIVDEDLTNLTSEEYRSLTAEPPIKGKESGTQHN
jgi:hypothetical protein